MSNEGRCHPERNVVKSKDPEHFIQHTLFIFIENLAFFKVFIPKTFKSSCYICIYVCKKRDATCRALKTIFMAQSNAILKPLKWSPDVL